MIRKMMLTFMSVFLSLNMGCSSSQDIRLLPSFNALSNGGDKISSEDFLDGNTIVVVTDEDNEKLSEISAWTQEFNNNHQSGFNKLVVTESVVPEMKDWHIIKDKSIYDDFKNILPKANVLFYSHGYLEEVLNFRRASYGNYTFRLYLLAFGYDNIQSAVQHNRPQQFIDPDDLYSSFDLNIGLDKNIAVFILNDLLQPCGETNLMSFIATRLSERDDHQHMVFLSDTFSDYDIPVISHNFGYDGQLKILSGDLLQKYKRLTRVNMNYRANLIYIYDKRGFSVLCDYILDNCDALTSTF